MQNMDNKRIGWIGLGNMGTPMALNLVKAGFEVAVYNRTAAKAAPLEAAGARLAKSPAELCERADVVITMVADDAALKAIHDGGLRDAARAGQLVIDMSTVSPATTRELAASLAEKRVDYLDAPVSGSVKPAELGQLVIIAGGKKEAFDAAQPILGNLGKPSFWLGEQASGNMAKLAINLLLAFQMQGLAEAVVFAREKGIRPESFLPVIEETGMANGISRGKGANILGGHYEPAFELRHMVKDLRLVLAQGMHTPGGLTIHDSFQQALNAGWGEKDMSAIFPYLDGKKV